MDGGDWAGVQEHEASKTGFIMDMMQLMGYDAVTVGEREFTYGYKNFLDLAKKRKLTIVSANIHDKKTGKLLWKPYVVTKKLGEKVAIAGLISRTVPLGPAQDSTIVDDPLVVAQKLIPEMRKKADVVVLLAHMGRVDAEDLASQVKGIDVLVVSHHPGLVLTSRKINQTISVASGEQGQNIGETLIDVEGKTATPREGKVVILTPEVGERADLAKMQKDFEDELNRKQREKQQKEQVGKSNPGDPRFLGMDACITCHQPQYDQWKTTAHAHSFETLQKQSKEATPDCVKCHVTGWSRLGGFQSQATTATLANVQCETCHGMGTEHNMFSMAASAAPPESVCVSCHNPANDPSWNYAAKLPKVVH